MLIERCKSLFLDLEMVRTSKLCKGLPPPGHRSIFPSILSFSSSPVSCCICCFRVVVFLEDEEGNATALESMWKAKHNMGASNSRPVTSKFTDGGETDRLKYAVSYTQVRCRKMEDAVAAFPDLDDTKSSSFFAVYDGHGGADVAQYCAQKFHAELLNHSDYQEAAANAVRSVFFRMDDLLQQSEEWRQLVNPRGCIQCLKTGACANFWPFKQEHTSEGSSACVVLIKDNKIIVGNVGDSGCVLSRNGQVIVFSNYAIPTHMVHVVRQRLRSGETDLRLICEELVDRFLPPEENLTVMLVLFKRNTNSEDPYPLQGLSALFRTGRRGHRSPSH
ncbi:hypothetical protein ACP70R_026706 [Stipagrostis hirtigluma subsp. patula]